MVAFLRQIGAWFVPHPWVNLFVPAAQAHTFIGETLANLAADDVGQGPILIYPFNRALFERATELGGKRYPFDSVPMTRHDWQKHYQPAWGAFVSARHAYDPEGILTPGQGIF